MISDIVLYFHRLITWLTLRTHLPYDMYICTYITPIPLFLQCASWAEFTTMTFLHWTVLQFFTLPCSVHAPCVLQAVQRLISSLTWSPWRWSGAHCEALSGDSALVLPPQPLQHSWSVHNLSVHSWSVQWTVYQCTTDQPTVDRCIYFNTSKSVWCCT